MEEGEKEIINSNLYKLCKNTECNSMLLAKLVALKILTLAEVADIEALAPSVKSSKFYGLIQTRTNGFASLKTALLETNQTGALNILENGCAKTGVIEDIGSLSYDLNLILGKGSHGTAVFKGKWGGRDVAVKSVPFDILDKKKASNEVDLLKTCDAHENIVHYFGSRRTATSTLIVLELCDMSLKEWVRTKSIDFSALEILRQVTVGLQWLHGQKIIHTDLKPENILLIGKPPRVKISDFAMSRRIVDGKSCVSTAEVGWVAPEILAQIIKENSSECKFTFSSDIFALGCVYYFVLTDGKHPFGDKIRSQSNILDGKIMIDYQHVRHGCVQNVSFIKSMISKNPEKRPPCSALLSCPIFWDVNQGIKFLTDLNAYCDVNVKEKLAAFKTDTRCRLVHKPENEAMWTLFRSAGQNQGCIIPYAYLHFKHKLSEAINENAENLGQENEITPEEIGVNLDVNERNKRSKVRANVEHWIKKLKQTFQGGKNHEKWKPPPMIDDNNNSLKIERLIADMQEMTLDEKTGRLFRIIMTEDAETIKGIFEKTNKTMKLRECWDAKLKSLLHIAVECREFSIVEFLVKHLGFSEMLSKPNMSDLIHTCLRGSESIALPIFQDKFEIIQLLVNINPTLIEKSDSNYQSPLHRALCKPSERQLEIILMLIQNKANVNAKDDTGKTPLHYAVQQKPALQMLPQIIKLLMDNGADPDLVDGVGQSFLHCAASSQISPALYRDLVDYLASVGREKFFNCGDKHGTTVLHFAVYFLEPLNETLELFQSKGVDFKAVDEGSNSVIFYAIKGGRNDDFLKMLFTLGADWRTMNSNGDTALHCAALSGNLPALKLFISLGYDLDTTNLERDTPLHKALEGCNDFVFQIVKELVGNGAAKGLKNKQGKSPFELAREYDKMVKAEQKIISLLETV